MKAVYYEKFQGPVDVREVQDPIVSKGSVIVKVGATGLCRSDWHGWMGHDPDIVLPHVPGHELAGIIVETGLQVIILTHRPLEFSGFKGTMIDIEK